MVVNVLKSHSDYIFNTFNSNWFLFRFIVLLLLVKYVYLIRYIDTLKPQAHINIHKDTILIIILSIVRSIQWAIILWICVHSKHLFFNFSSWLLGFSYMLKLFLFNFLGGAMTVLKDWTQGLMHVKFVLYYWRLQTF